MVRVLLLLVNLVLMFNRILQRIFFVTSYGIAGAVVGVAVDLGNFVNFLANWRAVAQAPAVADLRRMAWVEDGSRLSFAGRGSAPAPPAGTDTGRSRGADGGATASCSGETHARPALGQRVHRGVIAPTGVGGGCGDSGRGGLGIDGRIDHSMSRWRHRYQRPLRCDMASCRFARTGVPWSWPAR